MTPGNKQHVEHAPIEATPKAKHGVKLHAYKLDYLADSTKGDILMLAWPKCNSEDVAFCAGEEEFIEVMRAIYARLAAEAHKRAAKAAEETGQVSSNA